MHLPANRTCTALPIASVLMLAMTVIIFTACQPDQAELPQQIQTNAEPTAITEPTGRSAPAEQGKAAQPDPSVEPPRQISTATPDNIAGQPPDSNTPVTMAPSFAHSPSRSTDQEIIWQREVLGPVFGLHATANGAVYVVEGFTVHAVDAWSGELIWSLETDGFPSGELLFADDTVYFGPFSLHVFAVDSKTGELRWRRDFDRDFSNLVMLDDIIYASGGYRPLVALDARSGETVWSYEPDGGAGQAAVHNGSLHALMEGVLVEFEARTGQITGRLESEFPVRFAIWADGLLYGFFGNQDPNQYGFGRSVHVMDLQTGELVWRHEGNQQITMRPTISGGVAYIGTEDGYLRALDGRTGELLWEHQVGPEDHEGAPLVVKDDLVYFGAQQCCVYALDVTTGERVWEHQFDEAIWSLAVSSEGVVYAGSGEGRLYALQGPAAGSLVLPTPTPAPAPVPQTTENQWPEPPVATTEWKRQVAHERIVLVEEADGVAYAWSRDGYAYAFATDNGRTLWRYDMGHERFHYRMDLVADGAVYIRGGDGSVQTLDAESGGLRWAYGAGQDQFTSVSASEGRTYLGFERDLVATDADTGEKQWLFLTARDADTSSAPVGIPTPLTGTVFPYVVVADGVAYPYSWLAYDGLRAVDTNAGELLWEYRAGHAFATPPVVASGAVYVGTADGQIHAVEAASGKPLWTYDAPTPTGGQRTIFDNLFEPLVVDDAVYVASTALLEDASPISGAGGLGSVHAMDAETGKRRWRLSTDGIASFLEERGGVVYLASQDGRIPSGGDKPRPELEGQLLSGHLHAIDSATGEVIWSGRTTGNPASMTTGENGVLYVHSFDVFAYTYSGGADEPGAAPEQYGHVTAYDAATGQPLWTYRGLLMTSSLPVGGGTVLAATPDGRVYALSPP